MYALLAQSDTFAGLARDVGTASRKAVKLVLHGAAIKTLAVTGTTGRYFATYLHKQNILTSNIGIAIVTLLVKDHAS